MRTACQIICLTILVGLTGFAEAGETASLQLWAVDPLVKVFRDAAPPQSTSEALADVARGEYASLQVVVRCPQSIRQLRAAIKPLTLETDPKQLLADVSVRFVGYVPVDRPIQDPVPSDQLRKPPADYPDPLLEEETLDVAANEAQPIWITVAVPAATQPGLYRGSVRITGMVSAEKLTTTMPIAVKVYDVVLGKPRLWTSNWPMEAFLAKPSCLMKRHAAMPAIGSPEYWTVMRRLARKMAEHRQNVLMISPFLAKFTQGPDGKLQADFSDFDRQVSIFIEEGVVGRLEGLHLGERAEGLKNFNAPFIIEIRKVENGEIVRKAVDPTSQEADEFYSWFFPRLVNHLKEKGWLDRYCQHLGDEPADANIASYRDMANLVRKYAPQIKFIEACHTKNLEGAIDVWVPIFEFFHQDYETYRARQKAGAEVWFYTCCFPKGEYANRFLEQPLIKTRFLHWVNFRYGATGYLHWGFDWWPDADPFTHTTPELDFQGYLPAGDSWIIYPGKDRLLDSIRYEAMRDGIDDHELLSQLAERDPAAAAHLADKHVLNFDKYDTDVSHFRATRRELLELLSVPVKK